MHPSPLLIFLLISQAVAFIPTQTSRILGRKSLQSIYSRKRRRLPSSLSLASERPNNVDEKVGIVYDDTCEIGVNTVDRCETIQATESELSVVANLAKCICGAGSFALPHVFLEEGVLGGIVAITVCGSLATITMKSLADSKKKAAELVAVADSTSFSPDAGLEFKQEVTSYVELARVALGEKAANVVFALTLSASLGVCSTYIVFIGQTLESMSIDATSDNIIRSIAPNIPLISWEVGVAFLLYPLSLLRDYRIFAFTSALGVFAVVGGIAITLAYGILVDPGGGISVSINAIENLRMWPESFADAFGGSFGTIAYLFCINFLTFPIINSMKEQEKFGKAARSAVSGVWIVNVVFAILCLGFYGDDTQDLVLANLDNGPFLSSLKLLLCVDLLFTFPIVLSSGRQILENSLIGPNIDPDDLVVVRAIIVAVAVSTCLGLAQIGGFAAITNLVGGVAQGTLAFIMPPAIALSLSRQNGESSAEVGQWLLGIFGVLVVSSVTYFTAIGLIQ